MKRPRDRSTGMVLAIVVAGGLLAIAGCDPRLVASVNGLGDGATRPEPFDKAFVGEWYGPSWERVEWKVERLLETDTYFVTYFDAKGEKTFYTAAVFEMADLTLMDLQEAPGEGRKKTRSHLIVKVDLRTAGGLMLGAQSPEVARKVAALGGGPLIRYRSLKLQPLRGRFLLDHPDLIAAEKTFDAEGRAAGPRLTASPEELRAFFKAHGSDEGLWVEDERAIQLEARSK